MAIYLAVNGRANLGDVLVFSMLFLNVMAPLSEIHRILDEGHEASLRVGDLLDMLHQPVDRSFKVVEPREPKLIPGAPVVVAENLTARYATPDGNMRRGLDGFEFVDPLWPNDWRRRPIRFRKIDLDQGAIATNAPV